MKQLSLFSSGVNTLKISLLTHYLIPGPTLDVGCGNGLYGNAIVSKAGKELLQVDLVDRRFPEAKVFSFQAADAQNLDFPDNTFTNIVAFDVMEHLQDDETFLRTLHRICHGRIILSVPNEDDTTPRKLQLTYMHHCDKTHVRQYTPERLRTLLEACGFQVLLIKPHLNRSVLSFASAFTKKGIIPKIAARLITWQVRAMHAVGLFDNRFVADWFCVAERY